MTTELNARPPHRASGRVLGLALAALLATAVSPVTGQVTLDEGRFRILLDGEEAGTELFTILRDGLGTDATILATVQIDHGPGDLAMRPMLQADARLEPTSYQNVVSGARTAEVTLRRNGRRFAATILSERGEAVQEFRATTGARIVEPRVATLYWFLTPLFVETGTQIPIVEPETGGRLNLVLESVESTRYRLGRREVDARTGTLRTGEGDVRRVWWDDDGRILRVEAEAQGFVAERIAER